MSSPPPSRILLLRPDTYGDLVLFEPVARLLRHAWPQTEVGVLIRKPYVDLAPLLEGEGVRFLMTSCDPYREAPGVNPDAWEALRDTVREFAPDCVVAACTEQTWLEAAVGTFLPEARQVSVGSGLSDPLTRAALEAVLPIDWEAIYPERIAVEAAEGEWEKNLRLASVLLGGEAPRWRPVARVPAEARKRAERIVAAAGLRSGEYVVCAAAGTANVRIKCWPAGHYGGTLGWLERERGVRALLIGHASERAHLEEVREAARRDGADPALWLGRDGEMPVVAGLLEAARFYFGNDTGTLHLAAALGKPVVAVFGGGHWPRFKPVARRALSIVQPLPCFGCAWDCHYVDAPCVRTISPAPVRQALEQFLRDEADGQAVFPAEGLNAAGRALIEAATPRLQARREDSANRLRQVAELTGWLRVSEADRDARLRQVEQLAEQLEASEADREARLTQTHELTTLLETSEADRAARGSQVAELTAWLQASEADRDARQLQVQTLTALLRTSETDREARCGQIQELTTSLQACQAELTSLQQTREAEVAADRERRQRLHGSETQRVAARAEARRLTRELALTRRLLRLAVGEAQTPHKVAASEPMPSGRVTLMPSDPPHHIAPPLRVAVDLSHLRPDGENGGIKPFLFETLLWLGRQPRVALQLLYLTCSHTHAEVCDTLARVEDEVICVRDDGGPLPHGDERAPCERRCVPPPTDLLWQLGARVLYCPFGPVDFALPGIGTISTVVDVLHRDFPWSLDPRQNAERERVFQDILAVADALQCNSEHVVARMRAHYGDAARGTFVVYNAVHGRFDVPPEADDLAKHRSKDRPFFFYPANAWKHKNHEVLLLAYGLYRARAIATGTRPWPLVLTGHEDARWAELRALADTLGLLGEESVRFLGYVSLAELSRLWATAGALVFPSLHEGFGIPLLDALQHDVPILCSREGSLPEVGADACLFVDARRPEALAAGMTHLATDPALREHLVHAGRRRLRDFSQDHEAGRLLDTVVALAANPPPYRPFVRGIFADGWTEASAIIALPGAPAGASIPGTLTLRFHPMPADRRLRVRAGESTLLGSFDLPSARLDHAVSTRFYPAGGALFLEVPDAANLHPADARVHGVRLRSIDLRLEDGREYVLFAAP